MYAGDQEKQEPGDLGARADEKDAISSVPVVYPPLATKVWGSSMSPPVLHPAHVMYHHHCMLHSQLYCSLPSLLQLLIGCEVDDRLHFENNGYNVLWPIHHFNDKWSVLLCCNAFSELQPYLFSCINCTLHSQHSTVVMLQGIWCKHHYLEFW